MIRPFQFSDVLLIQRLGRQATTLNIVQSLLQPQSPLWASLGTLFPWSHTRVITYVLRQQGHGLARVGFLQAQKRSGRPEADIMLLAPALDQPLGHPAIWEKLLSHYINEAAKQQIARIYLDAPDQPLPVKSCSQVGFQLYARQTIWRLRPQLLTSYAHLLYADIRPQVEADTWALRRLYTRLTPERVQIAEGIQADGDLQPTIVEWRYPGVSHNFVLVRNGTVAGSIQIIQGGHGYWLQIWADTLQPDMEDYHQLLCYGLTVIAESEGELPIYVGVYDYQGGVESLLGDYGFAPFTDRAKMVKHLVQWVHKVTSARVPAMESVGEAIRPSFMLQKLPHTLTSHRRSRTPAEPSPSPGNR